MPETMARCTRARIRRIRVAIVAVVTDGKSSRGRIVSIYVRNQAKETEGTIMTAKLIRLLADETGGEVLEYALIAGLIVVAAIAAIAAVGNSVLARWTSLQSSM